MPLRREAGTTPEKEWKVPEATVRKRPWHRCPSSPGAERPRDGSRGHGQADHAGRVHRGQTSIFTLRARGRLKRFGGGGGQLEQAPWCLRGPTCSASCIHCYLTPCCPHVMGTPEPPPETPLNSPATRAHADGQWGSLSRMAGPSVAGGWLHPPSS